MSHQDQDAERVRLLSICAHAASDVLRSDEVHLNEKVETAAEFVEIAREILEKQGGDESNEPV
jgi:hypothetical protein